MGNAEAYRITAEDKATFDRDGYWISPKLLTDEKIERLREAHDRIWAGEFNSGRQPQYPYRAITNPEALRKFDNGWWINDEVFGAVTDPLMGEWAADLLGVDEIRLWHDQVLYKPGTGAKASSAGNVGWHQDYGYWQNSSTTNMITAWIALQDTTLENGGMMTILGSHKWGLVPGSDTFFDADLSKLKQKYTQDGREWVEEPCILKAGQASFHHALTFHGSGPNRTNEPRLSVVAHLMPGGTAYRPGAQRHGNVSMLGPRPYEGQLFEGPFFPLLFKR